MKIKPRDNGHDNNSVSTASFRPAYGIYKLASAYISFVKLDMPRPKRPEGGSRRRKRNAQITRAQVNYALVYGIHQLQRHALCH